MLAQRVCVEVPAQYLALVVSQGKQAHERLCYLLPGCTADIGHLLFYLDSQARGDAASIERRLQQDMLLLAERDHEIAICLKAVRKPALDIRFHLGALPVAPRLLGHDERHLAKIRMAGFAIQVPRARIAEPVA